LNALEAGQGDVIRVLDGIRRVRTVNWDSQDSGAAAGTLAEIGWHRR